MLRGTIERGTGTAAKALAACGGQNRHDQRLLRCWALGYTPKLATGVWVGYDRLEDLGRDETGSRVAVPIWTAFMTQALAGAPIEEFPIPDRVVMAPVEFDCGRRVRSPRDDGSGRRYRTESRLWPCQTHASIRGPGTPGARRSR